MTAAIEHRDGAVRAIADAIADRTSFVLTAPPEVLPTLGDRLAMLPAWTAYVDNGQEMLLRAADDARLLDAVAMMSALGVPTVAVVLVPKVVPARKLGRAIGQDIPTDGSRDVLILGSGAGMKWPAIFVDALDLVDPIAAAQLRASAVDR